MDRWVRSLLGDPEGFASWPAVGRMFDAAQHVSRAEKAAREWQLVTDVPTGTPAGAGAAAASFRGDAMVPGKSRPRKKPTLPE